MKIVIIDDESASRNTLKALIGLYHAEVQIVGEAANITQAQKLIEQTAPQIVFLDVEMPDGTGFQLLEQLSEIFFKVIFMTAHEKYALNAFRFSAIDYLLKPINPADLQRAMQKAKDETHKTALQMQVNTLLENLQHSTKKQLKKIVLKDTESIHFLEIDEIIRLEAIDNYTIFFLTDNQRIMISKTLKEYEVILEEVGFFRTHKSHLINLKALKRFDKKNGGIIIMKDDAQVPISKRKKDVLLQLLEML